MKRRRRAASRRPYGLALLVFILIVGAGLHVAELGTDSLMRRGGEAGVLRIRRASGGGRWLYILGRRIALPQTAREGASFVLGALASAAGEAWRALLELASHMVRLLGLTRCQTGSIPAHLTKGNPNGIFRIGQVSTLVRRVLIREAMRCGA